MTTEAESFLTRWHAIVAAQDLEGLREVLADDISMGAPPYWHRVEGKDVTHHLLSIIIRTIAGFHYEREWVSGNELALEFRGAVGELEVQGIDLITLDTAGRVSRLDVMIRPHNAVSALIEIVRPQMIAFLAESRS